MKFLPTLACHLRYALILLLVVVVLVLLSKWSATRPNATKAATTATTTAATATTTAATAAHVAAARQVGVQRTQVAQEVYRHDRLTKRAYLRHVRTGVYGCRSRLTTLQLATVATAGGRL